MGYLETIKQLEQHGESAAVQHPPPTITDLARDTLNSIMAVRIGNSLIGDFWLCLSDTELFDPDDGLPIYRPSEIKALNGKGYSPQDLQAVHRAKVILDGRIDHAGT